MDIKNFLGGATSLDPFLKAYKSSETKRFFPYEWFDHPTRMEKTEFSLYDAVYSKFRSPNPFGAEYMEYVNFLKSGLTTDHAVNEWNYQSHPYWDWEISIPAIKKETETNELIQRLFAMV